MNRALIVFLASGLLIGFAGCGGAGSKVSGKVTIDGAPLKMGDISFSPVQAGPAATGKIDANGNYTVRMGTSAGIPPGSYKVTIVAVESVPATPENPMPLPKMLTPPKYNNADTSGLTAEVKAGSNSIPFDLKSMP